jgi:hypothetical protein
MKPLRRIMNSIDLVTEDEKPNKAADWHKTADPSVTPQLGQVTAEDISAAISSTKAAAKIVNNEKYFKWMANYGST